MSDWAGTGTAISSGTFQGPGLTCAEVLARVADLLGWSTSDATSKSKIYEAVTATGEIVCKHMRWWFLKKLSSFTTTADVASYNLKTVNNAELEDMDYPVNVWYRNSTTSRDQLANISFETYIKRSQTQTTSSKPTSYSLFGDSVLYLHPTPNESSKTIDVFYIRKHGKINADSVDADLIIPGEFHRAIYVNGAAWALRHETADPYRIKECPQVAEALIAMASNQSDSQDYRAEADYGYRGAWGWQDKRNEFGELILSPSELT